MPVYKIQAPDGRIVSVQGDTPPNDADLDGIFSQLPDKSEFTPEQSKRIAQEKAKEASPLSGLVRTGAGFLGLDVPEYSAALEKEYRGGPSAAGQLPKQFAKTLVQGAPLALPLGKGKLLAQMAKTGLAYGASKTGQGLIEGKKLPEAISQGVNAGKNAALFTGGIAGAGKIGSLIGKTKVGKQGIDLLKSGASTAGEFLTGVPKDLYKRALNNPLLLKMRTNKDTISKEYDEAGKMAQSAINDLTKKASQATRAENQALKQIGKNKKRVSVTDIMQQIDDIKSANKYDGIQVLEGRDLSLLNRQKKLLAKLESQGGATPAQMHAIKKKIDMQVEFSPETVKKYSSGGEAALKEIRHALNKKLRENSPRYAKVNDIASEVFQLKGSLQTKLKDESVARNLRNLESKDEATKELFKKLNDFAPKDKKFLDKVKDTKTREAFNELIPGKGYTTGGNQGVGNIARAGILGSLYKNPLAAGAVATTFSPVVHRGLIKTLSNVGKLSEPLKKMGSYYSAQSSNQQQY